MSNAYAKSIALSMHVACGNDTGAWRLQALGVCSVSRVAHIAFSQSSFLLLFPLFSAMAAGAASIVGEAYWHARSPGSTEEGEVAVVDEHKSQGQLRLINQLAMAIRNLEDHSEEFVTGLATALEAAGFRAPEDR